ncbi:hypothetical protein D3C75_1261780 [compost metagenome]
MQGQGAALQATAGDQLQGDCGQAGDGSDAHGKQDQAGVLILDLGNLADFVRLGVPGQPQDQQQVEPDAEVPPDQNVLDRVTGRD